MSKPCTVILYFRDQETHEVVGTNSIECITNDDGASVVMGYGNLPGIAESLPGDIVLKVSTIAESNPTFDSMTVDEETGMQTIFFAQP